MNEKILQRLEFSNDYIIEVCYLIRYHDTIITDDDISNNYDLSYKKYKIQYADYFTHNPNKLKKRIEYLKDINQKLNSYLNNNKIKERTH